MTNGSQISVEQLKVASALTICISLLSNYSTGFLPGTQRSPQEGCAAVCVALHRAIQTQTMCFQSDARSVSLVTEHPLTSPHPLLRRRARVFSPRVILGSDWRCVAGYCLAFRKSDNAGAQPWAARPPGWLVCVKFAPPLAREGGRQQGWVPVKQNDAPNFEPTSSGVWAGPPERRRAFSSGSQRAGFIMMPHFSKWDT